MHEAYNLNVFIAEYVLEMLEINFYAEKICGGKRVDLGVPAFFICQFRSKRIRLEGGEGPVGCQG